MKDRPHRETTLSFYKEGIRRVLLHIQEELDAPQRLEDLAAMASLSPFYFHRIFRGMLGEPLAAHVRRLRLERAAFALKTSGRRIIEIALAAGYDSHEAFSRAFKQAFGLSPSRFRRSAGLPTTIRAPSGVHYRPAVALKDFRTLNHKPTMHITIETLPPLRVAYIRHTGPYEKCGDTWNRLCAWMGKEGYLGGDCRFVGVSYDDPEVTPPEKLKTILRMPVQRGRRRTRRGRAELAGCLAASTRHYRDGTMIGSEPISSNRGSSGWARVLNSGS